jgi:hypothetical protein
MKEERTMKNLYMLLAAAIIMASATQAQSQPEGFPNCDDAATIKVFEAHGVTVKCTPAADGTTISVWNVNNGQRPNCMCNAGRRASSRSCDPGPGGERPCFGRILTEAPAIDERYADPVHCSTSGGTRDCKCIDNPFTTVNECP